MRTLILFTILCFNAFRLIGQGHFVLPIEGTYGSDFIIVNYVDWGAGNQILDNHCLDKTYNGHQGTDFVIKHFSSMDAGVNVRAVDTGIVIAFQDGLFDREKTSDTSKRLGNYIGISHANKLQSYYGHLKNGSINVKLGDTVYPGSIIGQVGSSGNSSDPHLHFELWYDSSYYIDPFKGPCGNPFSYWHSSIPFDSSFFTWDDGLVNFQPGLDTLKEGLSSIDTFYAQDEAITFWSLHSGLRLGDSLKIRWFDPNGNLWFEYAYQLERNWWLYYYWSYINTPKNGTEGLWKVQLLRNNMAILEKPFHYFKEKGPTNSLASQDFALDIQVLNHSSYWELLSSEVIEKITLVDVGGQVIRDIPCSLSHLRIDKTSLAPGIYWVRIYTKNKMQTLRIVR